MTHTWQIHRLAPAPTPQRPSRRGEIHHTVSLNRPTLWARWCDPNPSLSLTRRPLNQGMLTVSLSASITGKAKTAAGRWLLPYLNGSKNERSRKKSLCESLSRPADLEASVAALERAKGREINTAWPHCAERYRPRVFFPPKGSGKP